MSLFDTPLHSARPCTRAWLCATNRHGCDTHSIITAQERRLANSPATRCCEFSSGMARIAVYLFPSNPQKRKTRSEASMELRLGCRNTSLMICRAGLCVCAVSLATELRQSIGEESIVGLSRQATRLTFAFGGKDTLCVVAGKPLPSYDSHPDLACVVSCGIPCRSPLQRPSRARPWLIV